MIQPTLDDKLTHENPLTEDNLLIKDLEKKLKKTKSYNRSNLLLNIYKQVVSSRRGKKTRGLYRQYSETEPQTFLPFVNHFIERLEKYKLTEHANRLKEYYSLY